MKKPKAIKPYWVHSKLSWQGRASGPKFYQSVEWRRIRKQALQRDNYLCVMCNSKGITRTATVVDHIEPIRLGGSALDLNNLQSLCKWHHNSKSAGETFKK